MAMPLTTFKANIHTDAVFHNIALNLAVVKIKE